MAAVAQDVATQTCRECETVKPLTGFYRLGLSQSIDPVCKCCRIKQSAERQKKRKAQQHRQEALNPVAARFLAMPRRVPPRLTD